MPGDFKSPYYIFFYSVKPEKNSYATTLATSIEQVVFYAQITTIYIHVHLFSSYSINYVEREIHLLNNI